MVAWQERSPADSKKATYAVGYDVSNEVINGGRSDCGLPKTAGWLFRQMKPNLKRECCAYLTFIWILF
eukprot:scaffold7534_cov161-Skeletonema_marinoi.AAC.1